MLKVSPTHVRADFSEGLSYWDLQRTALLQYIEAARKSDEGTELCKTRFRGLGAIITKIDIEIERLKAEASRTQTARLDLLKANSRS